MHTFASPTGRTSRKSPELPRGIAIRNETKFLKTSQATFNTKIISGTALHLAVKFLRFLLHLVARIAAPRLGFMRLTCSTFAITEATRHEEDPWRRASWLSPMDRFVVSIRNIATPFVRLKTSTRLKHRFATRAVVISRQTMLLPPSLAKTKVRVSQTIDIRICADESSNSISATGKVTTSPALVLANARTNFGGIHTGSCSTLFNLLTGRDNGLSFGSGSAYKERLEPLDPILNTAPNFTGRDRVYKEEPATSYDYCDILFHSHPNDSGAFVVNDALESCSPDVCLGGPSVFVYNNCGEIVVTPVLKDDASPGLANQLVNQLLRPCGEVMHPRECHLRAGKLNWSQLVQIVVPEMGTVS